MESFRTLRSVNMTYMIYTAGFEVKISKVKVV